VTIRSTELNWFHLGSPWEAQLNLDVATPAVSQQPQLMRPRDLQVADITADYVGHSFFGVILSSPFVWN